MQSVCSLITEYYSLQANKTRDCLASFFYKKPLKALPVSGLTFKQTSQTIEAGSVRCECLTHGSQIQWLSNDYLLRQIGTESIYNIIYILYIYCIIQ